MNMIVRSAQYDAGGSTISIGIPLAVTDHLALSDASVSATETIGGSVPYTRATASVQRQQLIPLSFGFATPSTEPERVDEPATLDQAEVLAALSPLARLRYLVRNKSRTLLFLVFSLMTWFFAAAGTWAKVMGEFVRPANAQTSGIDLTHAQGVINQSDAIIIFLGVALLGAFALLFFAKDDKKVKSGDDALKLVTGIIAGFMGGKAV